MYVKLWGTQAFIKVQSYNLLLLCLIFEVSI
jgi:hypothetical protein